jgi:Polyketide cyclase / dehydrase and lipid transport
LTQGAVTIHMNASPSAVWEVVSDVTRVGEFSPETFSAEWLDGATGPALGATFRGHVKRNEVGPVYWTTCRVTRCEPEKDFGFEVFVGKTPVNTWRYQLTPSGDGTPPLDLSGSQRAMACSAPDKLARRVTSGRNAGRRPAGCSLR